MTYSWDRGGRLLSAGGSSYAYNGLGNRLSQTVSAVVTDYLLDLQPGLSKVLVATTGANVDRFVHTPQGIHAQHDATNGWQWMIQDGLGSVRAVVDSSFDVDESRHYAPYGELWGVQGSSQTDFGFTGEPTDGNGLVHLRARYLNPALGVFPSLDPVEGALQQAMSLNRYGYVAGNVANLVDPSGKSPCASVELCPITGEPVNMNLPRALRRCRFNYSKYNAIQWALGPGCVVTPYNLGASATYCTTFMYGVVTSGGIPELFDPPPVSGFNQTLGLCNPLESGICRENARNVDMFVNRFLKRGCGHIQTTFEAGCQPNTDIFNTYEAFLPAVQIVDQANIRVGDLIYQSSFDRASGFGHISMFLGWGPEVPSDDPSIGLVRGSGMIPPGITQIRSSGDIMWVIDERSIEGEPPIPRPFSPSLTGFSDDITEILRIPRYITIDLEYLKASTR